MVRNLIYALCNMTFITLLFINVKSNIAKIYDSK